MIVSVSRRTDIPAFFTDWFFHRLQEGYALVPNPMNPKQVRRVALDPESVDGFVFWSKNPTPMLDRLDRLQDYAYYFQFTMTGYGPDVEPNVPDKDMVLIPTFLRLAEQLGPERMIWRYDPIFLSRDYGFETHINRFAAMARQLQGATTRCIISFLDLYRRTERNMAGLDLLEFPPARQAQLAAALVSIAGTYGISISTCAESLDLSQYGISHARCVDPDLFSKLLGRPVDGRKDRNQRPACGCMSSVDLGMYHTCCHGCKYCYANFRPETALRNAKKHDPCSPMLL